MKSTLFDNIEISTLMMNEFKKIERTFGKRTFPIIVASTKKKNSLGRRMLIPLSESVLENLMTCYSEDGVVFEIPNYYFYEKINKFARARQTMKREHRRSGYERDETKENTIDRLKSKGVFCFTSVRNFVEWVTARLVDVESSFELNEKLVIESLKRISTNSFLGPIEEMSVVNFSTLIEWPKYMLSVQSNHYGEASLREVIDGLHYFCFNREFGDRVSSFKFIMNDRSIINIEQLLKTVIRLSKTIIIELEENENIRSRSLDLNKAVNVVYKKVIESKEVFSYPLIHLPSKTTVPFV